MLAPPLQTDQIPKSLATAWAHGYPSKNMVLMISGAWMTVGQTKRS